LEVYSSAAPGAPLWTRALDLGNPPHALGPGRIVLGTHKGLVCLDERGQELWTQSTGDDTPRELGLASGVVVALLRSDKVLALDAVLGLTLWERTLDPDDNWS